MGISDRKRSIESPVNINLDLSQEPKPNQFLVDNNFKSGDFVSRKKSGNIFAGSKLNVDGQGILNLKVFRNEIVKKFPIDSPGSEGLPPTPSATLLVIPTSTPTPTPTMTMTPTLTPTTTVTPTPSVTTTVTPTITPTPSTTPPESFLSVWRTTGSSESITLPYSVSGTYSGTIDWGDGSTSVNSFANRTHTYSTPGDYQITIYGTTTGFRFAGTGDRLKIREILRWGPLNLGNSSSYFEGCSNLVLSGVTDILNLSSTTSLTQMFLNCSSLTTINNINSWNVANVLNFDRVFMSCPNFNDVISNWNVSNSTTFESMFRNCTLFNNGLSVGVSGNGMNNWTIKTTGSTINMTRMFESCESFNQDISNWNMSRVSNLTLMFYNNTYFNQPIYNWERTTPDVSSMSAVTSMNGTFYITGAFNQPIGNWDISNVTNLTNTFYVSVFDHPLSGWNTSNVTNMSGTFGGGAIFNQDISNWNMSKVVTTNGMFLNNQFFNNGGSPNINNWVMSAVTNTVGMFYGSAFNQPVNSWDVSNVTNMSQMFYGTPFNQPLSGWNVSKVTNMNIMFGLSSFDQPLNTWDVSKVVDMGSMFDNCPFNQNIGNWNVSGVTDFTSFMAGKTPSTLSTTNLDAIYNGWSSLPSLQSSINITFGSAKYTAGSSAGKSILQTTYGWTITDGGI
jgi:surface protein